MSESPNMQPTDQPESQPRRGGHRSIADGELVSTWSLKDYFGSLNAVLRLPSKPKAVPKPKQEFSLPSFSHVRLPKSVVAASLVIGLVVLVIRPIVLSASRADTEALAAAIGVWEAESGRYAGRMFELGPISIAFRTSAKSPEYTWHKIANLEVKPAGSDSTFYNLHYELDGKEAEFAFWLIPGPPPVIRVANQQGVTWKKTVYEPIARPR